MQNTKITSYFNKSANVINQHRHKCHWGTFFVPYIFKKETQLYYSNAKITYPNGPEMDLVASNADIWLSFKDEDGYITELKCDMCTRFRY